LSAVAGPNRKKAKSFFCSGGDALSMISKADQSNFFAPIPTFPLNPAFTFM
jgi:hypothetical protein